MKKVGFITLGCKVNIYESNALEQSLVEKGFSIIEPSSACDVFVINTCSVTNTADQKSRQMVSKVRKMNPNALVCVVGCYVQTNENAAKLDADIILGNSNKMELVDLIVNELDKREKIIKVENILRKKDYDEFEVSTYDHARAFVKIEDGCNQFCSYCIIPYARGPIRSKKADDVISELNNITNMGFEEVVLAGIHTGKYNDNGLKLSDLMERIIREVPLLKRLRVSSIEINEVDDKFIDLLKNNKIMANHLHLPLQTGNDKILSLMNRPYDTAYFLERVNKIREARPDIALTTDVIVGFPYETEEDHQQTIEFIKKVNFAQLHVFPYSKRNNTKAALMPQVNGLVKKMRAKDLINLSNELEKDYYKKFIGETVEVIFEQEYESNFIVGHSSNYLKVVAKGSLDFIKKNKLVKVLEFKDDVLLGEIIE